MFPKSWHARAMDWADEIEAHYVSCWGSPGVPCLFGKGPINELPPNFAVLKFPPRPERAMWTYATRCMSQPNDDRPLELHCFSARDDFGLVELLYATAYFHRTTARLDLGQTVNFGRAWSPGSNLTFGLVSLPYLDGPSLECASSIRTRFLWLLPVYEAEVAFKRTAGLEALEVAFEQANFDYLDAQRPSVA
jgi:hypothetical protein